MKKFFDHSEFLQVDEVSYRLYVSAYYVLPKITNLLPFKTIVHFLEHTGFICRAVMNNIENIVISNIAFISQDYEKGLFH